jgi:hypothetical protein
MKTLTDQQKLEILCAYLPHGVEVEITINDSGVNINPIQRLTIGNIDSLLPFNPRPILRHPGDMTDEELLISSHQWEVAFETYKYADTHNALNYLHSRLIDTFGAIEAGFAVRKNINEKGE